MNPLVTPEQLAKVIGLPPTDTGVISSATAANTLVLSYLVQTDADGQTIDHSTHAQDCEAALGVAVSVFQSRTAAGGQVVGLDYQPLPFRMGRNLIDTVSGLLVLCMDSGSDLG